MNNCYLCPRRCGALRTQNKPGFCGIRTGPGFFRVAKIMAHVWEEPYISGSRGSGTVFFAGCPLGCLFCQNHVISQADPAGILPGSDVSPGQLVRQLLPLVETGIHNINLVTASHFAADVPRLVRLLREQGVTLPIVWNTSAYESVQTLDSLEGSVDIFLPDFKFWDSDLSAGLAKAPDYASVAVKAILEMFRQKPVAVFDQEGLLQKGMALRLLVLPGHYRDVMKIIDWIARELPPDLPLAIMNQYTPFPALKEQLNKFPEMMRRVTTYEYHKVIEYAQNRGLTRLLGQERSAASSIFTPDF